MNLRSKIKRQKVKLYQLYKTHNQNLLNSELLKQSQKVDKLIISELKKQLNC
jgi:hypothetical protein